MVDTVDTVVAGLEIESRGGPGHERYAGSTAAAAAAEV